MLKGPKTAFLLFVFFVGGVLGQGCPVGTFPIFPSMACRPWSNVTPFLFAFVPTIWAILVLIKSVSGVITKTVNNEGMLIAKTKQQQQEPRATFDNLDLAG